MLLVVRLCDFAVEYDGKGIVRDCTTVGCFSRFADEANHHGDVSQPLVVKGACEHIDSGHGFADEISAEREVLNRVARQHHFGKRDNRSRVGGSIPYDVHDKSRVTRNITHRGVYLSESEPNPRHTR